jgi:hypothetical protein
MAPCRVCVPLKGVGRVGATPDFVAFRRTGAGGGASWTWETWAAARGRSPRRMDLCIVGEKGVVKSDVVLLDGQKRKDCQIQTVASLLCTGFQNVSHTTSRFFHPINLVCQDGDINTRSSRPSQSAIHPLHPIQPQHVIPSQGKQHPSNQTHNVAAYINGCG